MHPETPRHRFLTRALTLVRRRTSVILLYHGIGEAGLEDDPHNLRVAPDAFRAQITMMMDAGFEFCTVSDFVSTIGPGGPPAGLAAISFDDGMRDNHSTAMPILHELGAPATVYVLTGSIGKSNPWLGTGERMMTRDELRDLAGRGFELGAHTVTHPDMSSLSEQECLREMTESRRELEDITNDQIGSFAYPFGHYGSAAVSAARLAGFGSAVTCVNRGSWNRFELKRTLVTGRDGPGAFVARVSGIYEPLVLGRAGSVARRMTSRARLRNRQSR